jgi:hypothetical protein
MKKTPKILPTYYKSKGTPIFRDTTALPFAQGGILFAGGGPVKPPKFNVAFNPYAYNPNELVGYSGYGDLSGASIKASTQDLLGRQKDVNALKMPVSVSVNKLYDPNTVNDTIKYGYESTNIASSGIPASVMQSEAQKQLDSAYQPYLSKSPLGVNVEAGIAGSGLNSNIKKRSRGEMTFSGGYNPLSGLNAGLNTKLSFALGNDFYRPLKKGDWRVAANLQPFGMRISQAPGYSDMQDVIQQNLQNTAQTGQFNPNTPGFAGYSGKGYGSGVQATFGAGLDGELKLPLGTLVGGAGLKYNRAAGEAERLAPSGYLGYSLSGADMSKVASKLPTIPMPNLSPLTGMFNKAKEEEEGESSLEMPQETGTGWGDRNLPNATTLEGEEIYVPQRATPGAEPIEFNGGGSNEFGLGGRLAFVPSEYGSDAREQYDDGGPIYTYSKRPGSYYQKTPEGWSIKNSSTKGNYMPIDDPTGERAALLNKYATVYTAPVQGAPKPVMNQAVWNKAQQQGEQDLAAKQFVANVHKQSGTSGLYMPDGSLKPQAAQAADWVPQAMMGAPIAAEALGALGNSALGQAANIGFGLHGASQVPARIGDWQDVAAGNKDWKEATAESLMTGLELAGGYGAAKNLLPSVNKTIPQFTVQRPDLSHLGISREQQELLNLQQVNNTTMLSSVAPAKKLKLYGEDYKSPAGLPSYMNPSLYSQEEMARRMTPYQQALMRINQTEKAADRVVRRTTDDKVY